MVAIAHVTSGVALRTSTALRQIRTAAIVDTVTVSGTIFPSYAGSTAISNQQTVKPNADGTLDINIGFSNVVPGNNAYLILDLQAHATDGSQFSLGQLAALVDVTTTRGQTVVLTPETTQRFQVYADMLLNQLFSSVEAKQPDLDATLKNRIATTGIQPDPSSRVYTYLQLDSIVQALSLAYDRSVQVTANPRATIATLTWDWTNADEENLSASTRAFQGLVISPNLVNNVAVRYLVRRAGGPCDVSSAGLPGTQRVRRASSASARYVICDSGQPTNGGSSLFAHAYGGPVIAGATTGQPFASGVVHVAGTPAGAVGNVSVPLVNSEVDAAVSDTALQFNPGLIPGDYYVCYDNSVAGPFATVSYAPAYPLIPTIGTLAYAGTTAIVPLNAFSPEDLPPSAVRFCIYDLLYTPVPNAVPPALTSLPGTTYSVPRTFRDPGSNLAVYAYSLSGGLSLTQGSYFADQWYGVHMGTQTGSITTNAPGRSANPSTSSFVISYFYPDPPVGTTIAVVVATRAGAQYTGTWNHTSGSQDRVPLTGPSSGLEPLSQLSVRFTLPSGVATADFRIRELALSQY